MPEERTGRRATDERAVVWRDFARLRVLLWVIAGVCVLSWIGNGITVKLTTDRIVAGREIAVIDACRNDRAQDDVLRALIVASLGEQKRRGISKAEQQYNRQLAEQLLAPLGGLAPSSDDLAARCVRRLKRAVK